MENATKALEIAGGVLIGVLIIGCIVFGYTQISEFKSQEEENERIEQVVKSNKNFESYNKQKLNGNELFSLANMVEDYNEDEAKEKGYEEINLKITIKEIPNGAKYFKEREYNITDNNSINEKYKDLAKKIKETGNKKIGNNKNVSYWAKYGTQNRLKEMLEKENLTDEQKNQLIDCINEYNDLKNEQNEMIRKKFKCTSVQYNSRNDRIIAMQFEEI